MVNVVHPTYGRGKVTQVASTWAACHCAETSCPDCEGRMTPSHLAFIRWDGSPGGVAGGWYDVFGPEWVVEGAVELRQMVRALG